MKLLFAGTRSGVLDLNRMLVACALFGAAWGQACGGIVEMGASAGAAGSSGAGPSAGASAAMGDAARGAAIYAQQTCGSCHGLNAAGNQGPNITPSLTAGIGAWTFRQFHDAVRFGKDRDGSPLCPLMVPFSEGAISEQGIVDLHAFLRAKPAIDIPNKGSYCP